MAEELLQGKARLLKGKHVTLGREPARVAIPETCARRGEASPARERRREMTVTPQRREDGTIEAITVRCMCGREITLMCDYQDGGESP